jgi:uncharacterized protein YcbK (DUF882 family)
MATNEELESLRHFAPAEFHHGELMSIAYLRWLDEVRDRYAFPIQLTNDGRTQEENNALLRKGASPNSRHLVGEAVDITFPPTAYHLWRLVEAVFQVPAPRPIELELVNSSIDQHVHVAWMGPGRSNKLLVKAD